MLDQAQFHTEDPAKLREELDRFLIAVQAELRRLERRSPGLLFAVTPPVNGTIGKVAQAAPRPGQLVPLVPAIGAIDVMLPPMGRTDGGAGLALVVQSVAFSVNLRPPNGVTINGSLALLTLPAVARAYLALWDGVGWWTVNDA